MPAKRKSLSVRPSVYKRIREHCIANDLVMAHWVEHALEIALAATIYPATPVNRVPVRKRPSPVELNERPDELPAWQRPPFWKRS